MLLGKNVMLAIASRNFFLPCHLTGKRLSLTIDRSGQRSVRTYEVSLQTVHESFLIKRNRVARRSWRNNFVKFCFDDICYCFCLLIFAEDSRNLDEKMAFEEKKDIFEKKKLNSDLSPKIPQDLHTYSEHI